MKNVGLFCGGFSSEYEISMKSAKTIHDSFPKEFEEFFKKIISQKIS